MLSSFPQLDTEYRKKWDSLVIKLEVVDRDVSTGTEVVHWATHFPVSFICLLFCLSGESYLFCIFCVRRTLVFASFIFVCANYDLGLSSVQERLLAMLKYIFSFYFRLVSWLFNLFHFTTQYPMYSRDYVYVRRYDVDVENNLMVLVSR